MAPKTAPQALNGLPVLVSGPVEVGRLLRELQAIDETLLQLGIRQPGQEVKLPTTSKSMDLTVTMHHLNLLEQADRTQLKEFLEKARKTAPVMHISLSADPSPLFMEKLVSWLRKEIHPMVLVTFGLQPNMGAGCMVRTNNHYFDFSLRANFTKQRELLMQKLGENEPTVTVATMPAEAPQKAAAAPVKEVVAA